MAAAQGSTTTATLALNTEYVKSRPGILRILEACVGLCGVISGSQGAVCRDFSMYGFYNFVVVTTLIIAIVVIVIYTISMDKLCPIINFPVSILINDAIFSVLYLIAAILMFVTIPTCNYKQAARIVAAIFGIFGTIVVGLLAFDGYQKIRGGSTSPSAA